ncbi:helix-turn-helix domain-containing protein [Microlunatus parietis]|uniref:Transcriptional regulator with XRE-family HTH domain n=1 Tax=Microlunatus parietis TaxID=682979 RepID=A0A7Y9LB13_9ACTN|nr:helix-turn-helix transcriptional regulator [Microlunatus parietis]NYE71237.1 transcriptional regulator with XRE-family HTH domain [Microlunatus parietis]
MMVTTEPVGTLVRRWRERRRRSQLDVAIAAELSTRHLSYIETGRSRPSRTMIERLCEELEVPLRERNTLHLAAGFAPPHAERPFDDLGQARDAVRAVLAGHEPNPALAVNVRWELLDANRAMHTFLGDLPDHLAGPPLNVLRATLHPDGLAPQILNLTQWHGQVLRRVRRQMERTADPGLAELYQELAGYPVPEEPEPAVPAPEVDLVLPLRMITDHGELALLYATTVFGSPRDVTLDEIAIETFFPADRATADLLRALG